MLTVDETHLLKIWQINYDVIEQWPIHERRVRQLSFSPCDRKFASCSDDTTIKIWDLATRSEERKFELGSDVRTVDWHPSRALLVSGGKDAAVRFFDPRDGVNLSTLPLHKNFVTKVVWNQNGNWVLSSGRDSKIRLIDVRMMSEMMTFQGHEKEVFAIAWHPTQEDLFVSGGFTGEMHWWSVGVERPLFSLPHAQKNAIHQLRFHPVGHVLASAGQDGLVRWWVRNKAGDDLAKSSNVQHDEIVKAVIQPSEVPSLNIPGLKSYDELHPEFVRNIPTECVVGPKVNLPQGEEEEDFGDWEGDGGEKREGVDEMRTDEDVESEEVIQGGVEGAENEGVCQAEVENVE
jgi:WD40 repeat protein